VNCILNKMLISMLLLSVMPNITMADETVEATSFSDAITGGKLSGSFRLRWENVDQEGKSEVADAITLRSLVGYETKPFHGFSVILKSMASVLLLITIMMLKKVIQSPVEKRTLLLQIQRIMTSIKSTYSGQVLIAK
jgi:hypothetical protein